MLYYKRLSETDPLTSLLNFRGFRKQIKILIRRRTPFTLIILDIDHFRIYNKHGYERGDMVLKTIAEVIKEQFPSPTVIGRYKLGDEFIIALPMTDSVAAEIIIQEISERISNIRLHLYSDDYPEKISFSYGCIYVNEMNQLPEQIFSKAEMLLIRNKR